MRLRALTYNIHKCIGGLDRRYDPKRIADTIAHHDPDVVMLQEVAEGAKRFRHEMQVERLGELLGLRHRTYFVNHRTRRRGAYGNAVLSRFPIRDANNIDLTVRSRKRRSVLHARLRVRIGRHSRTVHVFNLHLGLSGAERKQQLRTFLESHPFSGLDARTPIFVAGDFNDVWGTLGPAFLVPAGFRGPARPIRTFPAYAPARALDSFYVRGNVSLLRVHRSRLALAKRASDHRPLIAELELRRR